MLTTRPAAMSAADSWISASAPGWDRMSRVSSSDSKSSIESTTATGRPCRVTVTRSWVRSTSPISSEKWSRASPTGITLIAPLYARVPARSTDDSVGLLVQRFDLVCVLGGDRSTLQFHRRGELHPTGYPLAIEQGPSLDLLGQRQLRVGSRHTGGDLVEHAPLPGQRTHGATVESVLDGE